MFNPRFPHKLSVLRVRKNRYGEPETDDKGNPYYDTITLDKVVVYDCIPLTDENGKFLTEKVTEIEFGYRTSSRDTSTQGDVVVSDYKIALPMFTTPILTGDILEIDDFDRTYRGEVVKKLTTNLGSNIWFNEVKN